MPTTLTQQVYDLPSLSTTHINPSIMEGLFGNSSILGADTYVAIVRYAPTFLVQPSITGSAQIPATLTCNPGVNTSSPRANVFYQWNANGVPILGATNRTFITDISYDNVSIDCTVTLVNSLGTDEATSNEIIAVIIQAIENKGYDLFSVTGLNQLNHVNVMRTETVVTTGMAQDTRLDVEFAPIMVASGMWVDTRFDMNNGKINVITGLNQLNAQNINTHDVYSVWTPIWLENLALINPGAELGNLTGWTVTSGSPRALSVAPRGSLDGITSGSFFFIGSSIESVNQVDRMYQDVSLTPSHESICDANELFLDFTYLGQSFSRSLKDYVSLTVECLNDVGVVLSTLVGNGTIINSVDFWESYPPRLEQVPANTRTFRVVVRFHDNGRVFSEGINAYIDDIKVSLYKAV